MPFAASQIQKLIKYLNGRSLLCTSIVARIHFMNNISTRIYAIALLLLATSAMNSAIGSTVIPKHFSASIGGAMDGYYHLELHNGTLTYIDPNRPATRKGRIAIRPTAKQWREFRQALDDLNIWQWQTHYRSRAVDGTQWTLDISYDEKAIKTFGDNSYPDAAGKPNNKPGYTATFNRYLDAIKKLIDGRNFN